MTDEVERAADHISDGFMAYDNAVPHLCRTDSDCYRQGWLDGEAHRARAAEPPKIPDCTCPDTGNGAARACLAGCPLGQWLAEPVTPEESALGMDRPWPLRDVLTRLADFAHDRLTTHDYDGHGWEELQRAKDEARGYIARWPAPQPKIFRHPEPFEDSFASQPPFAPADFALKMISAFSGIAESELIFRPAIRAPLPNYETTFDGKARPHTCQSERAWCLACADIFKRWATVRQ